MTMLADSRYRYCSQRTDENGIAYLSEREPLKYSDEPDNRYHSVKEGDTWWGLAHRYFPSIPRKSRHWWIIAEFQPEPVVDPTIKLTVGATLVVPSERYVRQVVFGAGQRRAH